MTKLRTAGRIAGAVAAGLLLPYAIQWFGVIVSATYSWLFD